ncbi:MAG: inositol monophosphatase [Chlamydiae bacterium]|nr:inositol monophosphatase [Chlamydiota bacterium]MBI3266240.1 inositol monophosphatase [Chlamydiota bacterium]
MKTSTTPEFPSLPFLENIALAAGRFLIQRLSKLKKTHIFPKEKNDYVTEVDQLSEQMIIRKIKEKYPGHEILAEESGHSGKIDSEKPLWIIDPLDGTTNFIHGLPIFAVSIALQVKGQIVLGVVYDPNRNELFSAAYQKGAFLNRKKIRVPGMKKLPETLLATGFPFRSKKNLEAYLKIFRSLCPKVSGIRRGGSAALDLAYVACGRFDGFWEFDLKPWDIAAGWLIIEEAGGCVSDFRGQGFSLGFQNVAAGNPFIYQMLRRETKRFTLP